MEKSFLKNEEKKNEKKNNTLLNTDIREILWKYLTMTLGGADIYVKLNNSTL